MDIPDRPPLNPYVYEQIELKLHEIDKSWWSELETMSVATSSILLFRPSGPAPPKRPLQLKANLQHYAMMLFNEESDSYYSDPLLKHWLEKLAERVDARVIQRVAELNSRFQPLTGTTYTLDHHG